MSSNFNKSITKQNFANADGGLAPVSAHAEHSAQPPSMLAEFFRNTCLHSNLKTFIS